MVYDKLLFVFVTGSFILFERYTFYANEKLENILTELHSLNEKVLWLQNVTGNLVGATGSQHVNRIYKNCLAYYNAGEKENDVYSVSPDGKTKFNVFCDMTNGGWTVIQRRINGAVSFDHGWNGYVDGFGDLVADHWLGLDYIHLLAKTPRRISFEFMMANSKQMATAVYEGFQVEDSSTNYTMYVSRKAVYNSEMMKLIDSSNGFFYGNGSQFSTNDRYNGHDNEWIIQTRESAWWYRWFLGCGMLVFTQINGPNFNDIYFCRDLCSCSRKERVWTSEVKIQ